MRLPSEWFVSRVSTGTASTVTTGGQTAGVQAVSRRDDATAGRYRRLRFANVIVGIVLAAEVAAMLLLSNDLSLPVFGSFLTEDPVKVLGAARAEELFSIPLGPAIALFLAFAALDHFLVAAPRLHQWYERKLDLRANYRGGWSTR